jgi:hydroxymethylbilane synthase
MATRRGMRLGVLEGRLGEQQAREILKRLQRKSKGTPWEVCTRGVKSPRRAKGARFSLVPVREFYSEHLHEALMSGDVDVAVHRLKDLPPDEPEGTQLAAVLERKTPLDVYVDREQRILEDLPEGARIGVSSLRRRAQLKNYRSDLEIDYVLGQIEDRLTFLEDGRLDGLVLAAAGMEWLELQDRVSEVFTIEVCIPAPGQGALGLVVRKGDTEAVDAVRGLNDTLCEKEIRAERALLKTLGAWPGAPVGALARVKGDILSLEAVIASPDGRHLLRKGAEGPPEDPKWVGDHLGRQMLKELGQELLEMARIEL